MAKAPKDNLAEAKLIAARMLAMPPEPHAKKGADKEKPRRRLAVSPKGRDNRRNSHKD
jgi:hypothetical protein